MCHYYNAERNRHPRPLASSLVFHRLSHPVVITVEYTSNNSSNYRLLRYNNIIIAITV